MGLKPDHWITKMAREQHMIEPFEEGQVRDGVISYGVSSYGYDIRVADEFKIFTNVYSAVVDPKDFDKASMVDYKGDICVIPPNSFALARTIEYFRIPRGVLTIWCCSSKVMKSAPHPMPIRRVNIRSRMKSSCRDCDQGRNSASAQPRHCVGAELVSALSHPGGHKVRPYNHPIDV